MKKLIENNKVQILDVTLHVIAIIAAILLGLVICIQLPNDVYIGQLFLVGYSSIAFAYVVFRIALCAIFRSYAIQMKRGVSA